MANQPNQQLERLLRAALKAVAPEREPRASDLPLMLEKIAGHTLNEQTLHEAARLVVEQSAKDDLRQFVKQTLKQFGPPGYKVTPDEVEAVIRFGKLQPKRSNIPSIRNAVQRYLAEPRRLVDLPLPDLRQMFRRELARYGNVDVKELNRLVKQYMNVTDPDALVKPEEIRALVKQVKSVKAVPGSTPETPTDAPMPPPKKVTAGDNATAISKQPRNRTFFDKIRLKMARYGLAPLTREARNWMTDTIRKVQRAPAESQIFEKQSLLKTVEATTIGKMCLFAYDAKWKESLPYWDAFPLIFVVEVYEDGWLGLNLHYLPMTLRLKLFDALLQLADDNTLDTMTRLRLSYSILKRFSEFPLAKPCIKKYLATQMDSSILEVKPVDYEIALFLPVEQFQKQSKEVVWRDARAIINRAPKPKRR